MPKTQAGTRILRAMLRAERRELQDSGICPTHSDHDLRSFALGWRDWVEWVHEGDSGLEDHAPTTLRHPLIY